MDTETSKTNPNDRVYAGFAAILKAMKDIDGDEAVFLTEEISGLRDRFENLTSGKREKSIDAENKERQEYITKLVFKNGNPKEGLKKETIVLTKQDAEEMKNLNINTHYSGEVVLGLDMFNQPNVKVQFPDGFSGQIFIKYSPENEEIEYLFDTNRTREEKEKK